MNRIKSLALCLPALLILSFSAFSQETKQVLETNSIIEENEIPGISIGYVKEGEVRIESGLGLKNATDQLDAKTVFSAASLSKPVFAYIVMQLSQEGVIDLNTPLYEYYTYPDVASDKRHEEVTAKMILSHTSGLPNWRKKKLKFKYAPGDRYSYSGEGFVWLQKVVEHLTEKDLETLAQEYVFQPLQMNRSSFVFLDQFEVNYSISFKENGESREKYRRSEANAAASLQTTGGDFAKFIVALIDGDALSDKSRELMFTPVKPTQPKEEEPLIYWGLGVGLQMTEGGPQIFQWGDNWTFRGYFTANITTKNAVVYLTNSENGLKPLREIVATYLDDPQPAADWLDY